jgi:hypothetical protein
LQNPQAIFIPYKENENSYEKMVRKWNLDLFLQTSKEIHGPTYLYNEVIFEGMRKPVKIICPKEKHGPFFQRPDHHAIREQGCPVCAREKSKLGLVKFIENSNKIHGPIFDYCESVYEEIQIQS